MEEEDGKQRAPVLQWWLLHQEPGFTAFPWCENENQIAVLLFHPTRVSYILIKGRSREREGRSWRDQVWGRTCTRTDWEALQAKVQMYRMHIYPLLWLTGSKHLVRCWSPLMLLPNRTAKKRLCDTDLRGPTYCRELVLMGPGRQMVSNTTRAFASSHKKQTS